MITLLSNIIANFFIRKNYIHNDQRDIYVYGCEAILSMLINSAIILISGIVFDELINLIIFYSSFLMMRKNCGGYHANSHLKCHLVFAINVLFVIAIIKNINLVNTTFIVLSIMSSIIIVFWLAPVVNESKPLNEDEIKKYKIISIIICLSLSAISGITMFFSKSVSTIISLALLSVSLSMFIKNLYEEKEVNNNEG